MTMTLQQVADSIRYVDDFPEPNIRFFDIESLVENPAASKVVMENLYHRYKDKNIDYVAGFDARGFLFGFALAQMLGVGFKQIRKPGKLPGETVSVSYEKEYGTDSVEMEKTDDLQDARVLLIDDLLATGGTGEAGVTLIEQQGGTVVEFVCVIELPELGARGHLLMKTPVFSLLSVRNGTIIPTNNGPLRLCVDPVIIDEKTGDFLLVERLSAPRGLAMAGGGIEDGESVCDAIIREIYEELGLTVTPDQVEVYNVLAGADRDPRGDQVSFVCVVTCDTKGARGEAEKTEPRYMSAQILSLVTPPQFAFADHAEVLIHEASTALLEKAS